eukprot:TRINITY_DN6265_c0_g1_i3.p1 TRINITY_DN6265_c0_g1~~TRINITY_DN6265_c0_g1_i3.p1  ORF type:complete len:421 (+),score=92.45 TRINITY_DN6265_c0_g1_i3:640-1902(+)
MLTSRSQQTQSFHLHNKSSQQKHTKKHPAIKRRRRHQRNLSPSYQRNRKPNHRKKKVRRRRLQRVWRREVMISYAPIFPLFHQQCLAEQLIEETNTIIGNALPSLQKKKDGDDSDGMEDDENLGISESSKEDSAKEPPKKQKAPEKKKDTPNVSSKAGSEGKKRKSVEGEAPQSDITVENARKTAKQKTKPTNAKEPRIALSGLVPSDRALAYDVVGNLGGKVVDVVDDATTHVVAASKRTVKMLAGIARGIWIVTPEWLFKSLDEGKWADESEFESNVVPGAKKARTNKALGMGLLFSSKTILVIGETTPPREEFEELIIAAGGEITQYVTNISFCVAAAKSDVPTSVKGVPVVLDSFVLDSLSQGRLLECDSYKHPSWDGKVDQEAAPVTGDDEGDEEDEQEDYQDAEDGDEQAKDDS